MAETDKPRVAGEGREPGFYWVLDEFTPFPVVARWILSPGKTYGFWLWPGISDKAFRDDEISVLSPRLEAPKTEPTLATDEWRCEKCGGGSELIGQPCPAVAYSKIPVPE